MRFPLSSQAWCLHLLGEYYPLRAAPTQPCVKGPWLFPLHRLKWDLHREEPSHPAASDSNPAAELAGPAFSPLWDAFLLFTSKRSWSPPCISQKSETARVLVLTHNLGCVGHWASQGWGFQAFEENLIWSLCLLELFQNSQKGRNVHYCMVDTAKLTKSLTRVMIGGLSPAADAKKLHIALTSKFSHEMYLIH